MFFLPDSCPICTTINQMQFCIYTTTHPAQSCTATWSSGTSSYAPELSTCLHVEQVSYCIASPIMLQLPKEQPGVAAKLSFSWNHWKSPEKHLKDTRKKASQLKYGSVLTKGEPWTTTVDTTLLHQSLRSLNYSQHHSKSPVLPIRPTRTTASKETVSFLGYDWPRRQRDTGTDSLY